MFERCIVYRLGEVPYRTAWNLQERLAEQIAAGRQPPTLLLLQHPHTYTFGRRGRAEHLLWDEAELKRRRVEVVWADRGGDVTYHGPGQLVGYPLLPLAPPDWYSRSLRGTPAEGGSSEEGAALIPRLPQADYVGYVRRLEETLIVALMALGVAAGQMEGLTGVWVQADALSRCRDCEPRLRHAPAKIAAIGVKVDAQGVSRHGFALNVAPDMEYWDGIVGCGLADYGVAALAELVQPTSSMEQAEHQIIAAFGRVFGCEMVAGGLDPTQQP